ncbi:MAG: NAD(P)/FAD-dependent oxidoreductase [Ktedonobacterales bacterium]
MSSPSLPVARDSDTLDALDDQLLPPDRLRHTRVAIVGTGFSGLGMAIRLKQRGCDDFVVLERADELGGTWRDNTYPGCACDIPSHLYSFSFAANPDWTRTYAPQREIQAYLRACMDRFGLRPHIRFNCELREARWNEAARCWHILTSQGPLTADMLVLGQGPLSEPSIPAIPGIESFTGILFHSARWRGDYDLTGKRVAVVGTGASAIQFVPHIQPQVSQLILFQRTPAWIMPRQDKAIMPQQQARFQRWPLLQRLIRLGMYWVREIGVLGLVYNSRLMKSAAQRASEHREAQIADPELRAKLTPQYTMGCKRILLSDDFYPAVSQPNVEVTTEPIRAITPQGVVTVDGTERKVDAIILATGFHVTDTPITRSIYGRTGQALAEAWRDGPQAYLGITVAGFPNLFLLVGPNTGLGHNSMVFMIESQVAYTLDALRQMERRKARVVEVEEQAQAAFVAEAQRRMQTTVWSSGCSSWYLDASGHNTTIWPGFTWEYRLRTRRFNARRYRLV